MGTWPHTPITIDAAALGGAPPLRFSGLSFLMTGILVSWDSSGLLLLVRSQPILWYNQKMFYLFFHLHMGKKAPAATSAKIQERRGNGTPGV